MPTVWDRIVQAALKIVLEPVFEADMLPRSFGLRPKRSTRERVRALREASGVRLDDANAKVKWYRDKLSKVENGALGLTERALSTLLAYYDVSGLGGGPGQTTGPRSPPQDSGERVTDWAKQYVPLERAASQIRIVYNEVPGLLETREWAKVYLAS